MLISEHIDKLVAKRAKKFRQEEERRVMDEIYFKSRIYKGEPRVTCMGCGKRIPAMADRLCMEALGQWYVCSCLAQRT